jgi:hypothetical protein
MKYTYRFYKDAKGWFIDYPEWIERGGTKNQLAMVLGADKMLEAVSKDGQVTLEFSDETFGGFDIKLKRLIRDPFGATYTSNREDFPKLIWLCNVTKAVFNKSHPKEIYIKVIK